jgi:thioredoxin 1
MSAQVENVTDAEFESKVLKSSKPVLVDFWAEWCGPCRMIAPVVEDLATELGDRVSILKMDYDQNPHVPQQLGILSIPTLMIFKDGKAADRMVGYRPGIKDDIKQKLEALV